MAVVVDDCCFAKPTEKQNPLQHLKGIHANLPFHWTAPVNSAIGEKFDQRLAIINN